MPLLLISRSLFIKAIARLCEKCDGKCPVCDSYVKPDRICDECNFGSSGGKCTICGGQGISAECMRLEGPRRMPKDRN
ncbi:hypothetical protein Clacol_005189 [Clathrus columnatus]|uniref:Uncharacterized protein n=1 Tax=Clathrus columnatus TaxID=1419009 RepID=A0AAV5AG97_9AGAM|nr:hypothetical protein Clacol_005189 [Clathrus columnatus]